MASIESMHAAVKAKYDKGRAMLAKRNIEIARVVRMLDDVPSRAELMQYERRFAELYEEVAAKLEENRKYVGMYNTLDQKRNFMVKQVALIDSINEQFTDAMYLKKTRGTFLGQMEKIVNGIKGNLSKQESRFDIVKDKLEGLREENQSLVNNQREYFKAVKDFQDECDRNERLSIKYEKLGGK